MCPQTVLNELFNWWSRLVKKLVKADKKRSPVWRKGLAFLSIYLFTAALSTLIGFNLAAYFIDPVRMLNRLFTGDLGAVTGYSWALTSALIFVDMAFWREKFCKNACPYGLMQNLLMDEKSLLVRYEKERDADCIHCNACVRDCIMGIDIRNSPFQTECIHCGICIDSCEPIMTKLGKANLITYSWGDTAKEHAHPAKHFFAKYGILDGKRWFILGLTLLYLFALVFVIYARQPLAISVAGDRFDLYHQGEDGRNYNDYRLKISNRSLEDGNFRIEYQPEGSSSDVSIHLEANPVELDSREVVNIPMKVSSSGVGMHPGPNRLFLKVSSVDDPDVHTVVEFVFFMPDGF